MKNNQWQKTTTKTTSEKVFVAIAPTETQTKETKKVSKETISILGRRFSIDDNGGGYKGL